MIEIPAPRKRDLAKFNQQNGLGFPNSEAVLEEHTAYWQAERVKAFSNGNMAGYDMAHTILETTVSFADDWRQTRRRPTTDRTRERSRLVLLNAMALGTLVREQWGQEAANAPKGDATVAGFAQTILDVYVDRGNPLDFRVHTLPIRPAETPDEIWYRTDKLLVRQIRPMEPTDAVAEALGRHSVEIDPTALETLYPYIPAAGFNN